MPKDLKEEKAIIISLFWTLFISYPEIIKKKLFSGKTGIYQIN